MKRITSVNNDQIRRVHALQQSTRRRISDNLMVVEGYRLVSELQASGLSIEALFCTPKFMATPHYKEFENAPALETWEVSEQAFKKMSDTDSPQGILAICPIPHLPVVVQKPLLYLIIDQVRDPGNLGTMLRTAWAAGVTAVYLLPGTIDPTNPKVVRAAMGAHFRIPIEKTNWDALATDTRTIPIWVADTAKGLFYDEVLWQEDAVLIIGGEADGAGIKSRNLALPVHIPMQSNTESLNAAVACAVILFEAVRQRRRSFLP